MSSIDYSAGAQLSAGATQVFVYGVSLLLLVGFVYAVARARRHARRARDATASVATKEPEAKGYAVLRGTVETEEPERPAIVVTVTEKGTETSHKGKYSHRWTEIRRQVTVEPFYLVLASDTRVRVEPGEDVFLVDKLERVKRGNPRTRRASLDNGEIAYVSGALREAYNPRADDSQRGLYRGAIPTGLVMGRGRERMLVSTEPLARRPQRLASAYRGIAILLGLALLLANGALFATNHYLQLFGEVSELRVLTTRTWTTRSKNSTTTHWGLTAAYPMGGTELQLDTEVSHEAYSLAKSGELKTIPFRVVPSSPSYYDVGPRPTIGIGRMLVAVGALILLVFVYCLLLDGAIEWYDRKLIVEKGSGRLQP